MMIQESVVGKITDINETGVASIKAIVPDMNRAVLRKYSTVHIIFDDGRRISCTQRRKCAVCGKAADIHHCEGSRIGAGVDRTKVNQLGREVLPLCRVHHTELHAMPESEFVKKYHLQAVKLDEQLCKRLKFRK